VWVGFLVLYVTSTLILSTPYAGSMVSNYLALGDRDQSLDNLHALTTLFFGAWVQEAHGNKLTLKPTAPVGA
jgi:hypothetical protein